jgi:hypothetical protein
VRVLSLNTLSSFAVSFLVGICSLDVNEERLSTETIELVIVSDQTNTPRLVDRFPFVTRTERGALSRHSDCALVPSCLVNIVN